MLNLHVYKTVLANGLTVLVLPKHNVPKVSLQLWYNVGAKDEQSGQKGIAHFIEHMIFKGTTLLSESDINTIVHKLSGYTNAFTSYDYTGYLFDVPSQHWQEILPIMADCMRNCTFKEDLLNSEMKAVIQELKMYNDDYPSVLIERMVATIFPDHPYHHPIIGYKQDLWNMKREALLDFYYTHYVPNNATLVVVGDVKLEEVFEYAEKNFGAIPANPDYQKQEFYHSFDLTADAVTIYRDIKQPLIMLSWVIPGTRDGQDYVIDLISWIIGAGKGSRLYKKIVDELGLATDLESFAYDLFDHGLFFIHFQPEKLENTQKIIDIITQEIEHLATELITDQELMRAQKKTESDFLSLAENNQKLAYLLGKYFIALGREDYLLTYCDYPKETIKEKIRRIIKDYLRPTIMYRGEILPLPKSEENYWLTQQTKSDQEDARVLDRIIRDSLIEEVVHAKKIKINKPKHFEFPKAKTITLSNGLKVFYHHNPQIPKIDVVLDLKAKHYYDPEHLQGLSMFVSDMLQEGTNKYSAQQFAQELESRGMELNTFPGQINLNMLAHDAQTGLNLLKELLTQAAFAPTAIERVRTQMLAELKNFWDTPGHFSGQLIRQAIYKEHPFAKNILGSETSINQITPEILKETYKKYITPDGARLAIVGDLSHHNIEQLLEETLGQWQGPQAPAIIFPPIQPVKAETIKYKINRDQTVLCFGGLSISRHDSDFDKILLFDQVFSGGVLGSMSSRLFELREQSGLFYTISGSLLAGVNHEPGMVLVKTIVSNDRLEEAEKRIAEVIDTTAHDLTQEEHEEAQQAIIHSLVDHFASNKNIAGAFLFLDEYGFSPDYFDKRAEQLLRVTRQEVQQAAQKILNTNKMVKLLVGRV